MAAGKAITERTRLAREAQKKATSKVAVIIENHKEKETPGADTNTESESTRNVLTTTQWLSVSIFASMIGIYYKRGEIKRVFSNRVPQTPLSSPIVDAALQAEPHQRKGICPMD